MPTAVQARMETQDTPRKEAAVEPTGFGVDWIDQPGLPCPYALPIPQMTKNPRTASAPVVLGLCLLTSITNLNPPPEIAIRQ
jgi:hypothetical protein